MMVEIVKRTNDCMYIYFYLLFVHTTYFFIDILKTYQLPLKKISINDSNNNNDTNDKVTYVKEPCTALFSAQAIAGKTHKA